MRRLEATAIYATVMAALLVSAAANSPWGNRMISRLGALRTPGMPAVMASTFQVNAPAMQQKVALAQARCAVAQARLNAMDQARMARDMAKLHARDEAKFARDMAKMEASKAKFAAMQTVWTATENGRMQDIVSSNDDGAKFVVTTNDNSGDDN